MGTHPIFESDFDCLTEIREKLLGDIQGEVEIKKTHTNLV